ncbi:MAG TPA: hypothetical protein VFX43_03510 [Chitinophagaceae bacterium]|nr:hypothetical protein [Chitinophagaceae bacterium]
MMTQNEVTEQVIILLKDFIKDWGLDEVLTAETKFNDDLCFSSIDMLHFLAVIDMNFQKKHPFEKLILANGSYRNELTVSELTEFIFADRDAVAQGPKPL